MGRTAAIVMIALTLGTAARAQGVAVNEHRAVGPKTLKHAIQTTSLAEHARTIGPLLAMPEASLQSRTPRQAGQGLRRSTKVRIGTAIGAGIGVSLAAGLCRSSDNCEPASLAAAALVFGGTGAGIGALVGFLTSR